MPDILDSAQKLIDDAAHSAGTPATPASPPPPPVPDTPPSSPQLPSLPVDLPLPKDEHIVIPKKNNNEEKKDEPKFVVPPPIHPPNKFMGGKGTLLALLALLVLLIPIAFFVAQRRTITEQQKFAGICCEGGTCNDDWSFGRDENAPQSSCDQRNQEACANRRGIKSGGGSCSVQPTNPPVSGLPDGRDTGCCSRNQQCIDWYGPTTQGCNLGNGACASGNQCNGGDPNYPGPSATPTQGARPAYCSNNNATGCNQWCAACGGFCADGANQTCNQLESARVCCDQLPCWQTGTCTTCTSDSQCSSNQYCSADSTCITTRTCTGSGTSQCVGVGSGYACDNGRCKPPGLVPTNTPVSTQTPTCNNGTPPGQCVPSDYVCTIDGHATGTLSPSCGTGLKCVNEIADCRPPAPSSTPTPDISTCTNSTTRGQCVLSDATCQIDGRAAATLSPSCGTGYKCVSELADCGGGTGTTCTLEATQYCVGNNPYGTCVDIGGYWCAPLLANNGKKMTGSNAGNCTCPSPYTWEKYEYGSWWCFNTQNYCSNPETIPGGLNTAYTCETTPGKLLPANYCTMPGLPTNTPGPTIPVNPTPPPDVPTNTPVPPGGQCDRIAIYDTSGTDITSALVNKTSTVKPGDTIVLAVAGTNATAAHFRVNGAPSTYDQTSQQNSAGEFILNFTLPTIGNQFTVEAEVLVNGTWK